MRGPSIPASASAARDASPCGSRRALSSVGVAVEDVLEEAGRHAALDPGEGLVGEREALHPRAVADPLPLAAHGGPHRIERAQTGEVGADRLHRPEERVLVAIDEARDDVDARAVEQLGGAVARRPHLGVVADRDDDAVAPRDRARVRARRVECADEAPSRARSAKVRAAMGETLAEHAPRRRAPSASISFVNGYGVAFGTGIAGPSTGSLPASTFSR